jgi:hypothetical protein
VGTGGAPWQPIGYDPTNNQIGAVGRKYDANGNMLASGLDANAYGYDAENRMIQALSSTANMSFAYDSRNKRIFASGGSTDGHGHLSGYTVYYYGVKGERLGQYNLVVTANHTIDVPPTSTEVYFGSRRLAALDRLGSIGTGLRLRRLRLHLRKWQQQPKTATGNTAPTIKAPPIFKAA